MKATLIFLTPLEWLSGREQTAENAGAVVEDGDAALTAKSADRSSHYGNQCGAFSEKQRELPYDPAMLHLDTYPL